MRSKNSVVIMGYVGQDPKTKEFDGGGKSCSFSVATTEKWKDKNTGEEKQHTEWHSIFANNALAGICEKYIKKGDPIYVEGSIKSRQYKDSDGNDRHIKNIIAKDVNFLGVKKSESEGSSESFKSEPKSFDDDIPF